MRADKIKFVGNFEGRYVAFLGCVYLSFVVSVHKKSFPDLYKI